MIGRSKTGWVIGIIACLVIWHGQSDSHMHSQAKPSIVFDHRELNALLYMQTSAEYKAACLQAYRWAHERLKAKRSEMSTQQEKPFAVVADLDETILDNSAINATLLQQRKYFTSAYWNRFVRDYNEDVRLVPGAKEFVQMAEQLGVKMVYISNRSINEQSDTLTTMTRLGLKVDDESKQLLLSRGDANKADRRKQAEANFTVLLYLGDNLRDFDESFVFPPNIEAADLDAIRKAIDERSQQVSKSSEHWGVDWIIIPNPLYGEWDKPARRQGSALLRGTVKPFPTE